uniref:Protein MAIN-LIKE 1-like n=1 Tax=Cicer arietinum TaxID=3827 RepID=A0A3Q7YDV1_CICAR|nr:protein MAIN-LIKE 1-like [Cicer arietinum]
MFFNYSQDRGSLKVIIHGLKLKKFSKVHVPDPVFHWIRESGLLHLSSAYLTMADVGVISAFVERRVEVKYVSLFIELDSCRDYSWGTAILVFMYDNLRDGDVHDTRQWRGYMTLLQRVDREAIPTHLPRACRWTAKHVVEGELMTYRRRLDALSLEDVLFTPYADDRVNHPFVKISVFSRYLRCGGVSVSYLPERCLR